MIHKYQDVNGPWVVSATETELRLNGDLIAETWALFPRVSADGRVSWKSHEDGAAWLYDGVEAKPLGLGTVGNWPVCWHPDGTLFVQENPWGVWTTITPNGDRGQVDFSNEFIFRNMLPAAQGIHHIEANGRIILNNDPSLHGVFVIDGVKIECWSIAIEGNTLVALADGGSSRGCVAKITLPNGPAEMWIPTEDLPHPPFISQGRVAISGNDVPDVGAVPWESYRPYVAPVEALPPVEVFAETLCWRHDLNGVVGNRFCGSSGHPNGVIEDPLWVPLQDEKRLVGIYYNAIAPPPKDPQGNVVTREDYENEAVWLSKRTGAPIIAHDDGHVGADIDAAMRHLESRGVVVVRGRQAYALKTDTPEQWEAREDAIIAAESRKVYLNIGGYDPDGAGAVKVAESNKSGERIRLRHPNKIWCMAIFGLDKGSRVPWSKEHWQAQVNATTQPGESLKPKPLPVDCVVSEPVCGPWKSASCLREERTCTRGKLITAPQHGGKPCPPLTWTETRRKYGRAK